MGLFKRITSSFALYKGLPKSIYALFFAQIVNAVGNLVYPFLTFFLTQRMHYDSGAAGAIILVASTAYVPGSLIGGKLADKIGRKIILIVSQGLAAAVFIPCAFLGISPAIPWLIIAANFFGGAANPCHEAITTDLTRGEQRKAAFSLIYLGHNIGFAVGPLIAGFLFTHALPWLFLGDAVTTFAALVMVGLFVGESKPTEEQVETHENIAANERAEKGGLFRVLLRRPFLLAFAVISTLLSFVYAQFTFSLPLQLEAIFPEHGPVFFGTIMTVNALVVITLTTPLISLTKKMASLVTITVAALLFAVGFGMTFFLKIFPLFIVSTILWTLGEILNATNSNVYIAGHTPITHRGRFNSILPIIMGAGFALGPPIMGQFIEKHGVTAVWPVVFFISIFAAAALAAVHLIEKRKERETGS